jgi:hypothetical protein
LTSQPTLFGLYAAVVMDVIISTYSEHVYSDNIVLHIASFGCVPRATREPTSAAPARHV